jgi:inorganic pyrophosphatase
MALLDEGETDFKIIVLDVKDPLAPQVNDIPDVEEQFPGLLDATRDWFRLYKVPDGKKANEIGLNEAFKDRRYVTHDSSLPLVNDHDVCGARGSPL